MTLSFSRVIQLNDALETFRTVSWTSLSKNLQEKNKEIFNDFFLSLHITFVKDDLARTQIARIVAHMMKMLQGDFFDEYLFARANRH